MQSKLDLAKINRAITDRSNCFYWQTDRQIEPAEAGEIFLNRHESISDADVLAAAERELIKAKLMAPGEAKLVVRQETDQNNLGNVNAVRTINTPTADYIMRMHPRGLVNGYFWAEALATEKALSAVPTYHTVAVHELASADDFAYMLIEKLPGIAVKPYLETHAEAEQGLVKKIGTIMARLHKVKVNGFGFFDNQLAKTGQLAGIKPTYRDHVLAGLDFNLQVLEESNYLTTDQSSAVRGLMQASPLLEFKEATIVHNDFADWNLLTDGSDISGVLDWDECHAGPAVADIACWSTFFLPERLPRFLEGYRSVTTLPTDFEERFELLRLRYIISKMTLRTRRYAWDPSDFVRQNLELGKIHLAESLERLGL